MAKCLALLAAAALATVSVGNAEPLKIRAGWAVVPAQLTSVIFENKDILKHYGTSYTFEPIRFRGSAPQITALAAGEIDIAAFAFSTFGLAIQNAKMEDIRVIGDLYQQAVVHLVKLHPGGGGFCVLGGVGEGFLDDPIERQLDVR